MAETISSAANPLVKRIRLLADRKHRRDQAAFVVEGIQPVWRAVTAGWEIQTLIADEELSEASPAAAMAEELAARGVRVATLAHQLFLRLSSREGSAGLAAIVGARPAPALAGLRVGPGSVFVALHQIGNPGNLGTIIRTVDAVGGAGVILIGASTDVYSPTSVKASMGSIFSVPVALASTTDAFFDWAARSDVGVVATSGQAELAHWNLTYRPPLALLFGSEGDGLPAGLLDRAGERVAIPMEGTAESLNLAAAAAVMLYEVRRHAFGPG
jgi:RNA methyltransferase, TrmH family